MSASVFRPLIAAALVFGITGAAPRATPPFDSQIVLERYELEMGDLVSPRAMIFSYTVSQAGPTDIEQRHRIYREGLDVRDETIAVDGQTLSRKIVRVGQREDRYVLARIAPRVSTYGFVFVRTIRDATHVDYVYEATPLAAAASGFIIRRVTIDGERFLPRTIVFTTSGPTAQGKGQIDYAPSGKYWVPQTVSVDAQINGKPARERITWSDYSFPPHLPPSTFIGPKPLPHATLPPI